MDCESEIITGLSVAVACMVMRKIDLNRIKRGKKPIFEHWINLLKHK